MVIFAQALGVKKLVTTIDASMAVDEVGFSVTRTRVGDTCVSEELRKGGDFGGEPSGSWIFPSISMCPDGIYAAAQDYDSTPLRRRSGYAVHDLGVAFDRDWYRLDVAVTNLFDEAYVTYRQSLAETYAYEEGRSVNLRLTARV